MSESLAANNSALVDGIVALLQSKLPSKQAEIACEFARLFYSSVSPEDIATHTAHDSYVSVLNLWKFMQDYQGGTPKIRVTNPDLKTHGWHSKRTVIEILHDDMPFLVDSVRMELARMGLAIHLYIHRPLRIARDRNGKVEKVEALMSASGPNCETPMYIEIDRIPDVAGHRHLEENLHKVLEDVRLTVGDFRPMLSKMQSIISEFENQPPRIDSNILSESKDFMRWLLDEHFIFLGYREYTVEKVKNDYRWKPVRGSSLGLHKKAYKTAQPVMLSSLSVDAQQVALNNAEPLVLTKTRTLATVHRPSQIDYIGIKRYDQKGQVIGEHRFFGLYTSTVYNRNPRNIPVIRHKIQAVIERSGLVPGSHDFKALRAIIESMPRDELFQISVEELLQLGMGVLYIKERPMIRLFIRRDPYGRFFSVFLYVPREQHTTKLRLKMQDILARYLGGKAGDIRFSTWFSESILARVHFIVPVENAGKINYDVKIIEKDMREAARSWDEQLKEALHEAHGEVEGKRLALRYFDAFSPGYQDVNSVETAVVDIEQIETVKSDRDLAMLLFKPETEGADLHFKLYRRNSPASLSEVLPLLENMGLTVIGEAPNEVDCRDESVYWVMDFSLAVRGELQLNIENVRGKFQEAVAAVWRGEAENDGFNRLVLAADLTWRQVSVLRAYAKYLWQIGFTFSQSSIEQTLSDYPAIARSLVEWFDARFNPDSASEEKAAALLKEIKAARANVATLDQDRAISRFIDVMQATLRTNFYMLDEHGQHKRYTSFKIRPAIIADIPRPVPMFEIFVYSPRVEGVHLRFGKVARGGLRWSDRREDFRTEVLGLVKAQQVKNTVIVPSGAKGGFVCKQMPKNADRSTMQAEGIACYQLFIRGLLDITDNIIGDKITAPKRVVRHDEEDPYLVVAADKGTATFSDIANNISLQYQHWLGDAFASGGSNGYDHKKMGITARGAWECVKRHFREMGKDIQSEDFTVIGVGDMFGDVFGNGMLLSKHIRLQAAFDHRHIFLDPNPDSAKSYVERERLFNLPSSSWDDYNKKLISKGGGIYPRSAKSIPLSDEVKAMLGVSQDEMSPPELMKAILKMDVELFWNGGIGTYVKASNQHNNEVGDRANDAIRVNGKELRAKVVGEGGNLGMTQLGRIEYMLNGGRGNTDFIDNAGGVNTSDNEVNIKILLNKLVQEGELTEKQRNKILADMTEEVAESVLKDNYRQSQSISITESRAHSMVKEHIRFIHQLEREGRLDRHLEYLPTDEEMQERMIKGKGLTRAELAILTAYGKMSLKELLNVPEVVNDAFYHDLLRNYFPRLMQQKFQQELGSHRLRNEMVAMMLANDIVNFGGANLAHRMADETGASIAEVSACFTIARHVFSVDAYWEALEALDNKVPAALQLEMMHESQRLLRRATRWFLRQRRKDAKLSDEIARFKPAVDTLQKHLSKVLDANEMTELNRDRQALIDRGLPAQLAEQSAYMSTVFSALDIAEVAEELKHPVELVAETYFKLGMQLDLHWFLAQIVRQPVDNHWQAFARAAFREELDWQQRQLTSTVLKLTGEADTAEEKIALWSEDNPQVKRWLQLLIDFRSSSVHEFAKFSVALRELGILLQSGQRQIAAGSRLKAPVKAAVKKPAASKQKAAKATAGKAVAKMAKPAPKATPTVAKDVKKPTPRKAGSTGKTRKASSKSK